MSELNHLDEMILVTSLPRTGSTLLWKSIVGTFDVRPSHYTPTSNLKKLHKYDDTYSTDYRSIFLFGNIEHSVISTRLKGMDRLTPKQYARDINHFKNCGYEWDLEAEPDIFKEDFLNYEQIFDEWMANTRYRTMCIRYETLYDNIDAVREFLEIDFALPEKRQRDTTLDAITSEQLSDLRSTYAALINKEAAAPDIVYLNR